MFLENVSALQDLEEMIVGNLVNITNVECGSLANPQRPLRPADQTECHCDDGWTGINCNGNSSINLVCTKNDACNSLIPLGQNATCYNSVKPVKQNHMMCDVTS